MVTPGGAVVIEQEPYAHAARPRPAQRRKHQRAGGVLHPVVILQVNPVLRGLDQFKPRGQRECRVFQKVQRVLVRVIGKVRGKAGGQLGAGRQGA